MFQAALLSLCMVELVFSLYSLLISCIIWLMLHQCPSVSPHRIMSLPQRIITYIYHKNRCNMVIIRLILGYNLSLLLHVFSSTKQTTATTNNLNRHHPNWTPLKANEKYATQKRLWRKTGIDAGGRWIYGALNCVDGASHKKIKYYLPESWSALLWYSEYNS